ncbi:hypothetical protein HCH_05038 [Hahella chejuensis KCTC 2396]|uniref:Lipoprotein n=1 Tax=Hahella chejuensis (strain KCTC 2396) TaxID=349521 RepID=Q2SCA3_HAHCH|nr:hypothetical protein [Hahella chejuensis]ABC31721.1 hypothetical protein HCH_05038 [Hahella chejuensis KCTC 2396]
MKPTLAIKQFVFVCITLSSGLAFAERLSMTPDFLDYFSVNPPRTTLPSASERELLERYKPRFFAAERQTLFIDFYRDYIAHGRLYDKHGVLISDDVSPETLNKFTYNPDVCFFYDGDGAATRQVAYGRVDYDNVGLEDAKTWTFLTYNLTFAYSGLPVGMPGWKSIMLNVLGDTRHWRSPDQYVAATIALDNEQRPVAVTLQQHDYLTTYILNKDLHLPEDGRILLDIARSSNELYPHSPSEQRRRAATAMTPDDAKYLIYGDDRPFLGGMDITHGQVEIEYTLIALPPDDAFYQFKGELGESHMLWDRDAPSGADYNIAPALKPKSIAMAAGYRREDDQDYLQLLQDWRDSGYGKLPDHVKTAFMRRFTEDLSAP